MLQLMYFVADPPSDFKILDTPLAFLITLSQIMLLFDNR